MTSARLSKPKTVECLTQELQAEINQRVLSSRFLTRAQLARYKLSPAALESLLSSLQQQGLELTPKGIRVALRTQLLALLADGARVPLKQVPKQLKGATASEVRALLASVLDRGEAQVVVRGKSEVLVGPSEAVLDQPQLELLCKTSQQLAALVKRLRAKGLRKTTLLQDITEFFAPWKEATGHRASESADPWPRIEQEMRRLEDPSLQLVWIPQLVRNLEETFAASAIKQALLDASRAGRVELRPEASPDLLAPADRALCVPGPRGTLLSYASWGAGQRNPA